MRMVNLLMILRLQIKADGTKKFQIAVLDCRSKHFVWICNFKLFVTSAKQPLLGTEYTTCTVTSWSHLVPLNEQKCRVLQS